MWSQYSGYIKVICDPAHRDVWIRFFRGRETCCQIHLNHFFNIIYITRNY